MRTTPAGLNLGRNDLSPYLVHLTRDDHKDYSDGGSAFCNLKAILDEQVILALRPHCLHRERIFELDRRLQKRFKAVCFTDIMLHELKAIARPIPGRQHDFEPFGLVFHKELMVKRRVQQTLYINEYGNHACRWAADAMFEEAVRRGVKSKTWRLLPHFSAQHSRYDFSWEQEFRHLGDFAFEIPDLAAIILPTTKYPKTTEKWRKKGVPVVDCAWSASKTNAELIQRAWLARSANN